MRGGDLNWRPFAWRPIFSGDFRSGELRRSQLGYDSRVDYFPFTDTDYYFVKFDSSASNNMNVNNENGKKRPDCGHPYALLCGPPP